VPDSDCASCGTVEAIRIFEVRGNVTGLRAGAGGAGGALIGNDHGSASGKGGLTTLGAADGSLAGSEIESNAQKRVRYRVTVRMDDASFRTVSQSTAPTVAVGDRVRIANGALVARY
jgi:outer membrane lipoprotein SlyB